MKPEWLNLSVFLAIFAVIWAKKRELREDEIKVIEFDVKPGGMIQDHEETWDGFSCKFTYACQGGTKEQWLMGFTRSNDQKSWKCTVERPGGRSYLFFQQFKLQVQGADIKEYDLQGEPDKALKENEYLVDMDNNAISHVEGKFQSQLAKVEIHASKGKEEL